MIQNHRNKIGDTQIIELYNKGITLHQAASELNLTTVTLWGRANKLGLKWKNLKREFKKFHWMIY